MNIDASKFTYGITLIKNFIAQENLPPNHAETLLVKKRASGYTVVREWSYFAPKFNILTSS